MQGPGQMRQGPGWRGFAGLRMPRVGMVERFLTLRFETVVGLFYGDSFPSSASTPPRTTNGKQKAASTFSKLFSARFLIIRIVTHGGTAGGAVAPNGGRFGPTELNLTFCRIYTT